MAVVLGCSSDPTTEDFVASFQTAYPDATDAQASCVVDDLLEDRTSAELERELEAKPPASSFERAQFVAMFGCGMRDDLEAQLETQLVDSGIPANRAPCAAQHLTDSLDENDLVEVLLDGEITDEFYDKYFVALDDCDALP